LWRSAFVIALNEAFMNKPATKEPSMDEILSSIRQIIADDDAAAAPISAPAPKPTMAVAPTEAAKPVAMPPRPQVSQPAAEPLALSAAQIVSRPPPEPTGSPDFSAMLSALDESDPGAASSFEMPAGEPELIDPEDVAFEPEPEPEPVPEPEPEPVAPPTSRVAMRAPELVPGPVEPRPAPRPAASVAYAAPMPDANLSRDMAEELLEPTTDAAVQGAMSRLSAMQHAGIGGMTVEAMIRDMLRPMLKDWLDENLPSLVERVVDKEIARISRGVK